MRIVLIPCINEKSRTPVATPKQNRHRHYASTFRNYLDRKPVLHDDIASFTPGVMAGDMEQPDYLLDNPIYEGIMIQWNKSKWNLDECGESACV